MLFAMGVSRGLFYFQAASTFDQDTKTKEIAAPPAIQLRHWERCFEIIATLTTGVIFIAKLLNPLSIFIASCASV